MPAEFYEVVQRITESMDRQFRVDPCTISFMKRARPVRELVMIQDLLDEEEHHVEFCKYNAEGENSDEKWCTHTNGRIYLTIACASSILVW